MGIVTEIINRDKPVFTNAKNAYYAIWVEDSNGSNERCWLLTHEEYDRALVRTSKNKEDCIERDTGLFSKIFGSSKKLGRIEQVPNKNKRHWKAKDFYYAVIVENSSEFCLLFTDNEITGMEHRANRNKEDIPDRSLLSDLLD